ncbi:globin family protein [Alteromonas sp. KUL49]|uniref:globin family protein n=1 Tax=Alteromonas sp. KUL49 TaxID=2480798 RepID=UPI00102EE3EC|nr:globin family protein [Alteromonas sp. KUL49]TAP39357.1 hemin receptor [Alteromonas sp. KUL49]GEA12150.1 hemoglobin [Alteromonas sp. KUL49]
MTPEKIALVQTSFKSVVPIADTAAELFYGRLFEVAPEVKPMFDASNMEEQGKKLMKTLAVAVIGLSDLPAIVPIVQQLGVKHLDYGVEPAHFSPVGESLLWTLEKGLGEAWNEELLDAWTEAYTLLSNTMIDAMEKAKAEALA